MKYSIIIPVYNRPEEVNELLQSLTKQTYRDMEVIIVEDGSTVTCESVVRNYAGKLQLRYYTKENNGPGMTRNFGAEHSQGDFLIILDSDCVLPAGFLQAIEDELMRKDCDAWGGPDRAHDGFSSVQKAINYSMTSFLTTGGIRGGKKQMDKKFYPRSFNMGIRRSLYRQLDGFSSMRFGEDIDLSLRIYKSNANCRLFPDAWVWHKRRTDFKKFFRCREDMIKFLMEYGDGVEYELTTTTESMLNNKGVLTPFNIKYTAADNSLIVDGKKYQLSNE